MIHRVQSSKSISAIDEAIRQAAARNQFGVITVHDLQQTLRSKGVEMATACLVYEVCNPQQARKVLEADGALSAALPCRISVYEAPDKTIHLATILPEAMMGMFGDKPELNAVAKQVQDVVLDMMNSAV